MKMQHKLKLVYFHFFNITVNLEIYSFSMDIDYIKTKRLDSIVIQAIKKCEKLKCIFGGFCFMLCIMKCDHCF